MTKRKRNHYPTKLHEFHQSVRKLRKAYPTYYPTHVFLIEPPKYWTKFYVYGDCVLIERPRGKHVFKIRMSKAVNMCLQQVGLMHEYAHALSWTPEHMHLDDHGPEWGLAMSRVYQCLIER